MFTKLFKHSKRSRFEILADKLLDEVKKQGAVDVSLEVRCHYNNKPTAENIANNLMYRQFPEYQQSDNHQWIKVSSSRKVEIMAFYH
jgi:hypothetical protein